MVGHLRVFPWTETFIAISLFLIAAGQQVALLPQDDPNWRSIEASRVIRVGMDPNYKPFEFWQDGQVRGFDVDLASRIGQSLGLEVEIVPTGMDSYFDALRLKQVDMVLSSLVPIPEYRKEIAYTVPYLEAGTLLLVPRNSHIAGPRDLEGRRVALELGSDAHRAARKLQRQGIQFSILTLDTADMAAQECIAGRADAVLLDGPSASRYILSNQLRRATVLESVPYVIATRADSQQLLGKLNAVIKSLERDGTLRQLELKWFGP